MTLNFDLQAETPAQIDGRLAKLSGAAQKAEATRDFNEDRVLDQAHMRHYEKSKVWGVSGRYVQTGTFTEARAVVESQKAAYDQEFRVQGLDYDAVSDLARAGITTQEYSPRYLAAYDQAVKDLVAIEADMAELDAEYVRRGGWTRTYLVVSSAGHLHSSTACSTCRFTTRFMLWYALSGLTEDEMIRELGDRADALCSVCYPDAPVAAKRKNITKAQAAKLAA